MAVGIPQDCILGPILFIFIPYSAFQLSPNTTFTYADSLGTLSLLTFIQYNTVVLTTLKYSGKILWKVEEVLKRARILVLQFL